MNTRTYKLQTRADTGVANPPRGLAHHLSPHRTFGSLTKEVSPYLTGLDPVTGPTSASYSDVVAPRPPSLRDETLALISARSSEDADSQIVPVCSLNERLVIRNNHVRIKLNLNKLTSSEVEILLLKELEGDGWTIVKHSRRVRSLSSKERTQIASKEIVRNVHAPIKANERMFKPETAAKSLAVVKKPERSSWLRREDSERNIAIHRRDFLCRGKGPSIEKEECISTQIWRQENVLLQERMTICGSTLDSNSLNQWNKRVTDNDYRSAERKRGKKTHQSSYPRAIQPARPAESHPVPQMANNDYFGMTFTENLNVGHCELPWQKPSSFPHDPGSSAGSVSDKSLSGSIASYCESDEPSDSGTHKRHGHLVKHGRNNGWRRGFSPQFTIGGSLEDDDSERACHQFTRESTAYLRDGKLQGQLMKMSSNENELNLLEFHNEPFSGYYCFAVTDRRMQTQKILLTCSYQNDRSISECTNGLQNLFQIGDVLPDRDKPIKFRNGSRLRPAIQKDFRQTNLSTPEVSFEKATAQAESLEILEKQDHKLWLLVVVTERASSSPDANPASAFLGRDSQSKKHAGLNTTSSCLRSQFWASLSECQEESIHHDSQESNDSKIPHKQVIAPTLQLGLCALKSRSQVQVVMSENECAVLLSARLVCIRVLTSVCHCGDMKKPCPTHAIRSMMELIASEPRRTFGFQIEPTATEIENHNSIKVSAHLPIGTVIVFSEETLVDSEVTGEFSKPLVNDSESALDTGMVWRKPFDDWTNYLPYLNATGDGPEILADRKHDFRNLGLELSRFCAKKNLKSDCLNDDGEVNGQVAMCNSPLENPYGDISYQYAGRRGNIPYLDHQVTRRHAMRTNIAVIAAKILADGIISSYPCADPMLNPKDGFDSHAAAYSCNEFIINVIQVDVDIFTDIPESWLAYVLFDFVGRYIPYVNHQMHSLFKKPNVETYQSQKLVLMAKSTMPMTRTELRFTTEITPKSDVRRDLVADRDGPLDSVCVPGWDKSEYDDKEVVDELESDKDVCHHHCCGHNYECHQIISGRWNEITYHPKTRSPSKYGLEGGIIARRLIKCQLWNINDILTKKIERVLTESQTVRVPGDDLAVHFAYKENFTCTNVDVYGVPVPGLETRVHIVQLQWDTCSIGRVWKIAYWIRELNWCDVSMRYAPELHRPASLHHVHTTALPYRSTSFPNKLIACGGAESRLVATSYWLDLGHLVTLGITAKKQRTAVFLQQLRIVCSFFALIDCRLRRLEQCTTMISPVVALLTTQSPSEEREGRTENLELRVQVVPDRSTGKYPYLQHNAVQEMGNQRVLPRPFVLLLDTEDFMFSVLVNQLAVHSELPDLLIPSQHTTPRSQSKVNVAQNMRRPDIILDMPTTPWMYPCPSCPTVVGFEPARVVQVEGGDKLKAQPLRSDANLKVKVAASLLLEDRRLEDVRDELDRHAEQTCRDVRDSGMDLLCIQAINHMSLLMHKSKTHLWIPFRCHEASRTQCAEILNCLKSAAPAWSWCKIITEGGNTTTTKHPSPPELCTGANFKFMEQIEYSRKLISYSPSVAGVLIHTTRLLFRATVDMKGAFEQIHLDPEHLRHFTITMLDVDAVILAIWKHLFRLSLPDASPFMNVHFDDIVMCSDNLNNYMKLVKAILDILQWEGSYLSRTTVKRHFVQLELRPLGHAIDNQGVRMNPDEVNLVFNGKALANRKQLRNPSGTAVYLVDDNLTIHMSMGLRSSWAEDTVPFQNSHTWQPAFEEVKDLDHRTIKHRRYSEVVRLVATAWMTMDGVAEVFFQGTARKKAKISVFSSADLNTARQTYAIHGIEMLALAGVGAILKCTDTLRELGTLNSWLNDHKEMIRLLIQRNLPDLLAQWLEKTIPLDFRVSYIKWSRNWLAKINPNYLPGIEQARAEIVYRNIDDYVVNDDPVVANGNTVVTLVLGDLAMVLRMLADAGIEAQIASKNLKSTGMKCLSWRMLYALPNQIAYTCFVPECLVGRKEGGCTSQDRTRDTNLNNSSAEGEVTMTAESATVTVTCRTDTGISKHSTARGVFHSRPLADGSTDRVKRTLRTTITEILHQYINPNQTRVSKDSRLPNSQHPEILELAVNFPKSGSTTGHALFVLNFVFLPSITMSWASASTMERSSICDSESALRKRLTVMLRNQKQSISFPKLKGLIQKLIPKDIGSLKTLGYFGNTPITLDSPSCDSDSSPKSRASGAHKSHASSLHAHATSKEHLFSGHTEHMNPHLNGTNHLHVTVTVDQIQVQARSKIETVFEIDQKSDFELLGIQFSRSAMISEDYSKSITCALILVPSTLPNITGLLSQYSLLSTYNLQYFCLTFSFPTLVYQPYHQYGTSLSPPTTSTCRLPAIRTQCYPPTIRCNTSSNPSDAVSLCQLSVQRTPTLNLSTVNEHRSRAWVSSFGLPSANSHQQTQNITTKPIADSDGFIIILNPLLVRPVVYDRNHQRRSLMKAAD